jgi:predicted nucleic acid-binding protein
LDDETAASLRASALDLINHFPLVSITNQVLVRAADPFPTLLRTLDSIHLATALALRDDYPDLVLASHDRELATAARSVGFTVSGA